MPRTDKPTKTPTPEDKTVPTRSPYDTCVDENKRNFGTKDYIKPGTEHDSINIDQAKKFQCEMAERVFNNLNELNGMGCLDSNYNLAISVSEKFYKHFFK